MKIDDVRKRAFAMPLTSPAFPRGPYRFVNREYLIINYRTDPAALEAVVPEPLTFDEPLVKYEFIRMPDSTGFGNYTESGQVIPVKFNGKEGNYTLAMYLNDGPPIYGGPGAVGFPEKICPAFPQHRQGHADRDARLRLDACRHRHHGLQTHGARSRRRSRESHKAELSSENHSACRRKRAHLGDRRLPPRGHRHEGRLVRPGDSRPEPACSCAGGCASGPRGRLGHPYSRRSHPRSWQGRLRLPQNVRRFL
jgi:Acetoacetate decarboxylase (ADC)